MSYQVNQGKMGLIKRLPYDATGNTVAENNRVFVYTQNNRLVEVTENSVTLGVYTYYGQGRRVKKVAGGQTTYFLYDQQSRLIAEADGNGDVLTEYLYLPDRPLVKIDIDGSSELAYYYHTDHLGTPLFMTNSTGQKVWSAEMLPFGEGYDINDDVDGDQIHVVNNLRFPGQYYDAETGLHYNVMRDYNPQIGRYIQSDPMGLPGGINSFAYAENTPINLIDPYGLQATGEGSHSCDTKTCVGIARFSAVGPNQATGGGALSGFGVSATLGAVAVSPAAFGLPFPEGSNLTAAQIAQRIQSQKMLAAVAGQIKIIPQGLKLYGGPTPPFTVGDIGDRNIRQSVIPRFDIYRFPSQQAALKFGIQDVTTTITIPATLQCPAGFQEKR